MGPNTGSTVVDGLSTSGWSVKSGYGLSSLQFARCIASLLHYYTIFVLLLENLSNDAPKEYFSDFVNDKGFAFLVNMISQFDCKVAGFCMCLLKILQFLSSATGFLVFLTLFG